MFHRTERLLLRPAWPEDAEALFAGIADHGVVRNLATAPWPYLPDHARQFVMRDQDARLPTFLVTMPTRESATLVGCVGLGEHEDGVELGYWIARQYWSRGFATEAARGVLEVAKLLGHQAINAGHFLDNPASGRVLRKLGFRPTGTVALRHSCARGEPSGCVLYRIDLVESAQAPPQAA